ncbi:hypothetical protein OAN61_00085 [bacterium]|nr:hypothetical protein [bacterium]
MYACSYCNLKDKSEVQLAECGECLYDPGGYFVINGSEKVVIAQERAAMNRVYCFNKVKHKHSCECEIKSTMEGTLKSLTTMKIGMSAKTDEMSATLPYIRDPIPIAIVFRAMNRPDDRSIMNHIVYDFDDIEMLGKLEPSIKMATEIATRKEALDFIGKRGATEGCVRKDRIKFARGILRKELLPHVGVEDGQEARKCYFFGYMIHRLLLTALQRREQDDRDHLNCKRYDMAGSLMGGLFKQLFRNLYKQLRKNLKESLDRRRDFNIHLQFNSSIIGGGLKYSLATGNWGMQKELGVKTGVSQVLNRLTYASMLSHLRRVVNPTGRDGKMAKMRQLHNTHWGMVCPAETPEGQAVGLVKNLSLMSQITVADPAVTANVISFLEDWGLENFDDVGVHHIAENTKVFVNGDWKGICRNPQSVTQHLRDFRRTGQLGMPEVSVVRDIRERELRIYTDGGRVCRPLFIVQDGKLKCRKKHVRRLKPSVDGSGDEEGSFGWLDMVRTGIIEYIDCEEEETTYICMNMDKLKYEDHVRRDGVLVDQAEDKTKYKRWLEGAHNRKAFTHCEVHPSMILGICASIIPFPDHNQSPRNCYQSAMGKQAMGVYITNYQERMDTMANVLWYPQQPLVTTRSMKYLKFRELPAGINAIVAIMCYSGYNQEDSIIMNQSSIDRGLFRSLATKTYKDHASKNIDPNAADTEKYEKPDPNQLIRNRDNFDHLDEDGFVTPGTAIKGEDIIMGKTQMVAPDPNQPESHRMKRSCSVKVRKTEKGIVDKVMVTVDDNGHKFIQVRIRNQRVPQIGDKFASRHGQKGTCGITYRMEDMPFSKEGIVPDIIMNPHAVPSRMTIGHLVECILGKVHLLDRPPNSALRLCIVWFFSASHAAFVWEPSLKLVKGRASFSFVLVIGPMFCCRWVLLGVMRATLPRFKRQSRSMASASNYAMTMATSCEDSRRCLMVGLATLQPTQHDAGGFRGTASLDFTGFTCCYCTGHTGRKLEAAIYFGPTYYQRLKHMVCRWLCALYLYT